MQLDTIKHGNFLLESKIIFIDVVDSEYKVSMNQALRYYCISLSFYISILI